MLIIAFTYLNMGNFKALVLSFVKIYCIDMLHIVSLTDNWDTDFMRYWRNYVSKSSLTTEINRSFQLRIFIKNRQIKKNFVMVKAVLDFNRFIFTFYSFQQKAALPVHKYIPKKNEGNKNSNLGDLWQRIFFLYTSFKKCF